MSENVEAFGSTKMFNWIEKISEQKHQEDLQAAKGWLAIAKENNNTIAIQILERFFPELRESDDELVRKAILHLVKSQKEQHFGIATYDDINWLDMIAWLEKQEHSWSEEDEELKNSTILYMQGMLEGAAECENIEDIKEFNKIISWLKSIKSQPNWKPSEYDISLLEEIARNIRNNVRPFCSEVSALEDLINNLKKL